MKFSLVFATRDRVGLLRGLLSSLVRTTEFPSEVEVMPVYDNDDMSMREAVPKLIEEFSSLNINFMNRERTGRINEDYINYAAFRSSGKYIFILNDDTEIVTQGWDTIAWNKLEMFYGSNDGLVYGKIDDSMGGLRQQQKVDYCGFPIVSRVSIDRLGYAMHPVFPCWSADVHLFAVYNAAKKVLDLSEVQVLHVSPHTSMREEDVINRHVRNISTAPRWPDINSDVCKLLGQSVAPPPVQAPPPPKKKIGPTGYNEHTLQAYKRRISLLQSKRFSR